ncbi:hypothetical protein K0M31_018058 [Melipona bicolor]|uniref:Methyltransferase type 12 domain-containing protein n=1 Tax=Melipona bicolor TaxID=60889 RepID=A0AA40FE07_9HYME|nr:hypothetical protein K0M31_018058 [Melipona bicolor]
MHMVEEYINASRSQHRDASEIIEEFKKQISEMKGKCIDIGCGPGDVSNNLILPRLSPEAELVGADISTAMIDHAKQKYQNEKRMSFLQLDIETPIFPDEELERYSNVLSFYCLHWCQNPRIAFENIYNLLKPEGSALVMFLAWNNGFDAYIKLSEDPRFKSYMTDASRFVPYFHRCNSQASLRDMLKDVGFEILHCSRREKSFVYQNMEIFKRHMIAVNPFISRMPDHLREEFEDVMLRELVSLKILIPKESDDGPQGSSILDKYYIFVAHMKKPPDTCSKTH